MPCLKTCIHFLRSRTVICAITAAVFSIACIATGYSSPLSKDVFQDAPVNFTAKTLSHDDEKQTVTATGDVELVQGDRILRADKMVYYLAEDRVTAMGNV